MRKTAILMGAALLTGSIGVAVAPLEAGGGSKTTGSSAVAKLPTGKGIYISGNTTRKPASQMRLKPSRQAPKVTGPRQVTFNERIIDKSVASATRTLGRKRLTNPTTKRSATRTRPDSSGPGFVTRVMNGIRSFFDIKPKAFRQTAASTVMERARREANSKVILNVR